MIEFIIKKGIRRTKLKMYESIEDLPVERFMKANKYWMLDDSIGSDISDFDKKHFSRLALIAGDKDKTMKELQNFRILVYNLMNEINVQALSFACMIHSINDSEVSDLSEPSLKAIITKLSNAGLTQAMLKKKLMKYGLRFTAN